MEKLKWTFLANAVQGVYYLEKDEFLDIALSVSNILLNFSLRDSKSSQWLGEVRLYLYG